MMKHEPDHRAASADFQAPILTLACLAAKIGGQATPPTKGFPVKDGSGDTHLDRRTPIDTRSVKSRFGRHPDPALFPAPRFGFDDHVDVAVQRDEKSE